MSQLQRIQSATGNSGGSSLTCTVTLGASPTNGNSLVLVIGDAGTFTVASIAQTGATWQKAVANNSNPGIEIWYATNVSGAGTTITITKSSSSSATNAVAIEYQGILTLLAVDQKVGTASGNSSTLDSGSTSTTKYGTEVWIGGMTQGNTFPQTFSAPTNNFAIVAQSEGSGTTCGTAACERIVNSVGVADVNVTSTLSNFWVGTMATFIAQTQNVINEFKVTRTLFGPEPDGLGRRLPLWGIAEIPAVPFFTPVMGITRRNYIEADADGDGRLGKLWNISEVPKPAFFTPTMGILRRRYEDPEPDGDGRLGKLWNAAYVPRINPVFFNPVMTVTRRNIVESEPDGIGRLGQLWGYSTLIKGITIILYFNAPMSTTEFYNASMSIVENYQASVKEVRH